MSALTVGSLFSGIGGFDLGLERAGMRVVWQCEADQFCQRVLAKHWPDVPCYPDVRALRGEDVAPVDVLCGGFPCQDLSWAGPGAGIGGSRSGLWKEYARLVGELRPRYVIVENVSALLARGMGVVLGDLAALGYDAEWDCIPASAVGAPHQRDRVWIVAYPEVEGLEGLRTEAGEPEVSEPRHRCPLADAEVVLLRTGLCPDEPGGQRRGRPSDGGGPRGAADVEDPEGRGGCTCGAHGPTEAGTDLGPGRAGRQWLVEPDVGRVAHGVPARVDRLRGLGNALVPQIAEWLGRRVVSAAAAG